MSSRDPRSWMWAEACELLDQAERLHRQFFRFGGNVEAQPRWEPPVDVVESGAELTVAIALPGVVADRIAVHVEPSGLVVTADRPPPVDGRTTAIRRLEIPYGRFERRVPLPPGRYDLLEQACENGCLMLRLARL
ncbi:MAG TPA: Hsp20/alpha crystallin family protein [Steroidobacteraceae bacterium]|nr:Hsp20/alpha crystallin family protein [Steroidobacteraceae bacterium]